MNEREEMKLKKEGRREGRKGRRKERRRKGRKEGREGGREGRKKIRISHLSLAKSPLCHIYYYCHY